MGHSASEKTFPLPDLADACIRLFSALAPERVIGLVFIEDTDFRLTRPQLAEFKQRSSNNCPDDKGRDNQAVTHDVTTRPKPLPAAVHATDKHKQKPL